MTITQRIEQLERRLDKIRKVKPELYDVFLDINNHKFREENICTIQGQIQALKWVESGEDFKWTEVNRLTGELEPIETPTLGKPTMEKHIYPDVKVIDNDRVFKVSSSVRKEQDGTFYYWDITEEYTNNPRLSEGRKIQILNKFHREAYKTIILGEVNTEIVDYDGTPIFLECKTQETEEERLLTMMGLPHKT